MDQVKDLLELVCDSSMNESYLWSWHALQAKSEIFIPAIFPPPLKCSKLDAKEKHINLTESRQIVFGSQRYTVKYP